jgi:hypothetical protein
VKISRSHRRFALCLEDQTALEYPEDFLGPNWKDVLNFWIYLDTLSEEQIKIVIESFNVVCPVEYTAYYGFLVHSDYNGFQGDAMNAAQKTSNFFIEASASAVCSSSIAVATDTNNLYISSIDYIKSGNWAAGRATYELIGSHFLLDNNKPLTFFPLFLNL